MGVKNVNTEMNSIKSQEVMLQIDSIVGSRLYESLLDCILFEYRWLFYKGISILYHSEIAKCEPLSN